MRAIYIIVVLFVLTPAPLSAQYTPENSKARNSFSFQFLGPEMLGFYYNHYMTEQFSLNAGIGVGGNSHIGINFYPFKLSPLRFYLGGQACLLTEIDLESIASNYGGQFAFYFPIGLQFIAPKGFTFHFEGGFNIFKEDYSQINTKPLIFAVRIGKTWFKQRK